MMFIFLLIGCSYQSSQTIKKADSADTYTEFVKDVSYIKKELNPKDYIDITTGEELNKHLTSFPDYQKLDNRKFDGVNGDQEKASRYEFFYINKNETILVRINFIYAPEYKNTKILSILSLNPGNIGYIKEEYQNLLSLTFTSYLITYKNSIATVDFFETNKNKNVKDQYSYLINEGEAKFLPSLQKIILDISDKK